MTPSNTYTATCWREEGAWVVRIPELDRTTRTARLSQVEGVARDMVARFGPVAAGGSARVVIDLQVPDDLLELLDAAAASRRNRDRVSVEAVTLRRGLARRLAAEGFAVRDVAALLGLSIVRAQQLIGETSHPPVRPAGRPADHRASPAPHHRWTDDAAPVPRAHSAHAPLTAGKPHGAFRHEAMLYRGDDDFLAGTVPFVLEGVELRQPVLVAVTEPRLGRLRAAVGADAAGVHYVDMADLGANPARIIPAWRAFVESSGGGGVPVRGIGEPVWSGRRATEIVECQLHEALLNLAVEPDTPLWLICPYDIDAHPAPVIEEAARSHPSLREGEDYRGSTSYGGSMHIDTLFAGALPPAPEAAETSAIEPEAIGVLRRMVSARAASAGMAGDRVSDLTVAVSEVATNTIRHGGGRGTMRIWQQSDALVVEVADSGRITDPLVGRRVPDLSGEGGRGLWLANQLVDLVQVRSGPAGTTVRLLNWR